MPSTMRWSSSWKKKVAGCSNFWSRPWRSCESSVTEPAQLFMAVGTTSNALARSRMPASTLSHVIAFSSLTAAWMLVSTEARLVRQPTISVSFVFDPTAISNPEMICSTPVTPGSAFTEP